MSFVHFAAVGLTRNAIEEVPVQEAAKGSVVIQPVELSQVEAEEVPGASAPAQTELTKPVFPVEKVICPGTEEYDNLMRQITMESEENNLGVQVDIPALGPSLLPDEVPMPERKPIKLVLEVDERKANAGFQNIMNAGRFWKASQMIGTRKGRESVGRSRLQNQNQNPKTSFCMKNKFVGLPPGVAHSERTNLTRAI